jgi:hypothetical protein
MLSLGLVDTYIMKDGSGPDYQRIAAFDRLYLFGVIQDSPRMLDPLFVARKVLLHFAQKPVPDYTQTVYGAYTQTLLGILTPLGTTKIYLWIDHYLPASAALQLRLILEEFNRPAAAGALYLEYVIRLPESLILSGTSHHSLSLGTGSQANSFGCLQPGIGKHQAALVAFLPLVVLKELNRLSATGTLNLVNPFRLE